jgi:predicted secreted Zn-dependent protease
VHLLRLTILISLLAMVHATASPTVKRRDETYDVTGSSLRELRQMIDRNGPVNKDDGKRYDGLTQWSLTWDYQLKRRGKVWIVSGRTVLLDIKVLTPRWTDFQNTPGALRTQWRIYRSNLLRHEEGHVKIALRAARAVDKYLGVCGASSSLDKLKIDIQKNTTALLKQYRKIDQDYDQRTHHGTTQGVSLKRRSAD